MKKLAIIFAALVIGCVNGTSPTAPEACLTVRSDTATVHLTNGDTMSVAISQALCK